MKNLLVGPHFMSGGTGLSDWLKIGVGAVMYTASFPTSEPVRDALVIGRPLEDEHWPLFQGDPVKNARDFVSTLIAPLARANPHIRHWQSRNEPQPKTDTDMIWLAAHMVEFIHQVLALGLAPVVGAFPVGVPDFHLWKHWGPVLRAARDYRVTLSRHSYGPLDEFYALRHRRDNAEFAKLGFPNMPLVITECGAETLPGGWHPWRNMYPDFESYFQQWIVPFEIALRQDSHYVRGATLFTLGTGGNPGWNPYDVAGTEIAQKMRSLADALGPPVDTNPPPTQVFLPGLDVSRYQGNMDFKRAQKQGNRFVFIKTTDGDAWIDPQFAQNWPRAKAAGLVRGAYHYYTNAAQPEAQADHFLRVVGKLDDDDLPLVVDIEDVRAPFPQAKAIQRFLEYLSDRAGHRPIIYTAAWFWNVGRLGPTPWASNYDLWVAHYTTAPSPILPAPWTTWRFWQYRNNGPGPEHGSESALIDQNWFNGDDAALRQYVAQRNNAEVLHNKIAAAKPVLPFAFFCQGVVPLFRLQAPRLFVHVATSKPNWIIHVVDELVGDDGRLYYKVVERPGEESDRWMIAPELK